MDHCEMLARTDNLIDEVREISVAYHAMALLLAALDSSLIVLMPSMARRDASARTSQRFSLRPVRHSCSRSPQGQLCHGMTDSNSIGKHGIHLARYSCFATPRTELTSPAHILSRRLKLIRTRTYPFVYATQCPMKPSQHHDAPTRHPPSAPQLPQSTLRLPHRQHRRGPHHQRNQRRRLPPRPSLARPLPQECSNRCACSFLVRRFNA